MIHRKRYGPQSKTQNGRIVHKSDCIGLVLDTWIMAQQSKRRLCTRAREREKLVRLIYSRRAYRRPKSNSHCSTPRRAVTNCESIWCGGGRPCTTTATLDLSPMAGICYFALVNFPVRWVLQCRDLFSFDMLRPAHLFPINTSLSRPDKSSSIRAHNPDIIRPLYYCN
jgi:hypothetical protein